MKIAHLLPTSFSGAGGLQVCVHSLCRLHKQKGVTPTVFHCDAKPKGLLLPFTTEKFVNFKLLTQAFPLMKSVVSRYVAFLQREYNFDLWQINGGYPYGAILADFFHENGIPCILRCSGDDIQISETYDYGVRRNPRVNRYVEANYKKYDALVAITDTVCKEYQKIGVPSNKIRLIPNGVDVDRIGKVETTKREIRKRHNIPDDAYVLLTVGRNHPKKDYLIVPEILQEILTRLNVFWIIIGKNSSQIMRYPGAELVSGHLVVIEELLFDNKNDIPPDSLVDYYRGADLFVMTSKLETFGIVLVEAMAAGLPIVCFDAPGVSDVMHKDCGEICKQDDTNEFVSAIINILTSSQKATIAASCRSYVSKFDWTNIADQYLALYKSLVS